MALGEERPLLRVVAAALLDPQRGVLIAQRPHGTHMAGRWEFPGGKIAEHETERAALDRELREELAIEVVSAKRSFEQLFDYPDRRVSLAFWIVDAYKGVPRPQDAQALLWVQIESLGEHDLLEADRPFIQHLQALQ